MYSASDEHILFQVFLIIRSNILSRVIEKHFINYLIVKQPDLKSFTIKFESFPIACKYYTALKVYLTQHGVTEYVHTYQTLQ